MLRRSRGLPKMPAMKNRELKTLADYFAAAKEKNDLPSDRQLAIRLGISTGNLVHLNKGSWYPGDATMIVLAKMAGVPADKALMDLNAWRCKDPEAKRVYKKMAATFGTIALMMGGPPGGNAPAIASTMVNKEQSLEQVSNRVTSIRLHYILWRNTNAGQGPC